MITQRSIAEAVSLARSVGRVFIATAGRDGLPHLAVARRIEMGPDGTVALDEWFCPGTVENAQAGAGVSLVAWDEKQDKGWQLLGSVRAVEEKAFLDGFGAGAPESHVPQVLRTLHVHVRKVLSFTEAPHDDREA